jgi:holo-[acyl-carrier protein] synthase
MIWGSGVDIVEVARIEHIVARHGERFLLKVFTPKEIAYCRQSPRQIENFAAGIAAKEAAAKAIGTGWRQGVHWKNFEVDHEPSGKPFLIIHGRAREILEEAHVANTTLSISHDGGYAIAHVIMEVNL